MSQDPAMETYIWTCTAGHESAHTELQIQTLRTPPRCPIGVDGRLCWALLNGRVRKVEWTHPE